MLRFLLISAILCIVLFDESHSRMSLEKFFKFGEDHDEKEFKGISSRRIDVDPPFRIFKKMRDYVYVQKWGTIKFAGGYTEVFYVKDDNPAGKFFYRLSTEAADLEKARLDIGSAFPAFQDIDLKWAVISTWHKHRYDNAAVDQNTFQGVLTTDGVKSFAMFYYNDTNWIKDTWVGFSLTHDTEVYKYVVEGSATNEALTMEHRSNMNSTGKWIFRIDLPKIYEPSSMCPKPPQPVNGFCKANEYIPDSEARCGCNSGFSPTSWDTLSLKCLLVPNSTYNWVGIIPVCRSLAQKDSLVSIITQPMPGTSNNISAASHSSDIYSKVTCPPPPMPQNAICEVKVYVPGSTASCTCLPNHRLKNPSSDFYCSFAKDGSLFWHGEVPICALNSGS